MRLWGLIREFLSKRETAPGKLRQSHARSTGSLCKNSASCRQNEALASYKHALLPPQIDLCGQIAVRPRALLVLRHLDDLGLHPLHHQFDLEALGAEVL
jgi:hypothetical protein